MKDDGMDRACNMHGNGEKSVEMVSKPEGKRLCGRPRGI
jgi:hypothetical protein